MDWGPDGEVTTDGTFPSAIPEQRNFLKSSRISTYL